MRKMREFHCKDCNETFERLVDDSVLSTRCKHCQSEDTKRIISSPAIDAGEFAGTVRPKRWK